MRIAKVLVFRNVGSVYDYLIPEGMCPEIGVYVRVPVGTTHVEGLLICLSQGGGGAYRKIACHRDVFGSALFA